MAARDSGFVLLTQYVRHIAEQLRRVGVSVERWLGLSRLTVTQLDDPAVRLSFAVFRRLVLDALALSQEPALGLFVGERLVAATHGIVGYAVTNSETIAQALEVCERFSRLRTSLLTITRELSAREVRLRFAETRSLGDVGPPILEAVIVSITNVLSAISMGACRPRAIVFPFAEPSYAALARELFGCPVRYGASWAGIVFPPDTLSIRSKMADADAFREAAEICQRELQQTVGDESIGARVRRLILDRHDSVPSLTMTARLLHMTERTLHRRLVDEGTSFRELLEEVRHARAIEHLSVGRLGMDEISYLLGYSELANFRRAFKRWEGMAPSTYRLRAQKRGGKLPVARSR